MPWTAACPDRRTSSFPVRSTAMTSSGRTPTITFGISPVVRIPSALPDCDRRYGMRPTRTAAKAVRVELRFINLRIKKLHSPNSASDKGGSTVSVAHLLQAPVDRPLPLPASHLVHLSRHEIGPFLEKLANDLCRAGYRKRDIF